MPIRAAAVLKKQTAMVKNTDLEVMTINQMWQLHEELSVLLSALLNSEKHELEKRLARLHWRESGAAPQETSRAGRASRRPYPRVLPKYRNPENPSETWSGRGKQPLWIAAALESGRHIDDFLITIAANSARVAY